MKSRATFNFLFILIASTVAFGQLLFEPGYVATLGGSTGLDSITGLVFHLDATVGVTLNGPTNVSALADQSSSGFNVTQSTAAKQPVYDATGVNGKAALVFPGYTDGNMCSLSTVTNCNLGLLTNLTVAFVGVRLKSGTGNYGYWYAPITNSTSVGSWCGVINNVYGTGPGVMYIRTANVDRMIAGPTSFTTNAQHNVVYRFNSATGSADIYMDGSFVTNTTGSVGTTQPTGIEIGAWTSRYGFEGKICEVATWNRVLTTGEVATVNTILKAKWGTP